MEYGWLARHAERRDDRDHGQCETYEEDGRTLCSCKWSPKKINEGVRLGPSGSRGASECFEHGCVLCDIIEVGAGSPLHRGGVLRNALERSTKGVRTASDGWIE